MGLHTIDAHIPPAIRAKEGAFENEQRLNAAYACVMPRIIMMNASMENNSKLRAVALKKGFMAFFALGLFAAAHAQSPDTEQLRKNLIANLPQLSELDEITPTPMNGLFEVRVGDNVLYTDSTGNFVLQGELLDAKNKRNLTQERLRDLSQIDFAQLPLADSFKQVRGDGSRELAIFVDPNCGYCKQFERDMVNLDNVTVHVFLYPILGQDSVAKSRNILCAKDPDATWTDWMIKGVQPPSSLACNKDDVLQRNLAFGRQHKINGTPTLFFTDGSRVPGAVSLEHVEKKLQSLEAAK